jgi:hypothetical protein
MAKNKVEIDVKVDDKGTTKKVGINAKKAADNLDKTAQSAHSADRGLKGAAQASSNTTKNFSKMSQGITGGLVPAYATLAANLFAVSAAFEFLKKQADLINLEKQQLQFAASTGRALGLVTDSLREASDGMLGFEQAAQAAAIGVAKGFSPQQLENLAVGARKASTALGRDFEDAFDRLVRGASKAEPELLDELGITLRLATATQKYADSINKNVKELTEYERSQAVLAETMEQLDKNFGSVIPKTNEFTKLGKTFSDIVRNVSEKALPAIEGFAKFINDNMTAAVSILGLFAVSILQSAFNFDALTESSDRFVTRTEEGLQRAKARLKELQIEQDIYSGGRGNIVGALTSQAATAAKGVQGLDQTKFGQALSAGGGLSKSQLAQMDKSLKIAEKQEKQSLARRTGAFKNATKEQLTVFRQAHTAMSRQSKITANDISLGHKKAAVTMQVAYKRAEVAITAGFARMGRAANMFGKIVGGLGRLLGWVGVVMLAIDAIKSIAGKFGSDAQAMDFTEGLEQTNKQLEAITKNGENIKKSFERAQSPADKVGRILNAVATIDIAQQRAQIKGRFTGRLSAELEQLQAARRDLGAIETPAKKTVREGRKTIDAPLTSDQEERNEQRQNLDARIKTLANQRGEAVKLEKEALEKLNNRIKEIFPNGAVQKALLGDESGKTQEELIRLQQNSAAFTAELEGISSVGDMTSTELRLLMERLGDTATGLDKVNEKYGFGKLAVEEYAATLDRLGISFEVLMNLQRLELRQKEMLESKNKLEIAQTNAKLSPFKVLRDIEAERLAIKQKELDVDSAKLVLDQARQALSTAGPDSVEDRTKAVEEAERSLERAQAGLNLIKTESGLAYEYLSAAGDAFTNSLTTGIEGLIKGTMTAKEAFRSMALSIIDSLAKIASQQLAEQIFSFAIGAFAGGLSASPSTGSASASGRLGTNLQPTNMNQSIGPSFQFATGGIASGPQAGYPVELHGTEAIVPLPNGKSIPVEMKGGAQGDVNNINVTLNMQENGQGNASAMGDNYQQKQLGKAITNAIQDELIRQKRPGGLLSPISGGV